MSRAGSAQSMEGSSLRKPPAFRHKQRHTAFHLGSLNPASETYRARLNEMGCHRERLEVAVPPGFWSSADPHPLCGARDGGKAHFA